MVLCGGRCSSIRKSSSTSSSKILRLFAISTLLVILQVNLVKFTSLYDTNGVVVAAESKSSSSSSSQQPAIELSASLSPLTKKNNTNNESLSSSSLLQGLASTIQPFLQELSDTKNKSQSINHTNTATATSSESISSTAVADSTNYTANTTTNTSTKVYDICFVTSIFAETIQQADQVSNVTELKLLNPTFHYILFTNLLELQGPGWEIIHQTNLTQEYNVSRYITKSRYGKFLAWKIKHPINIQEQCTIVFYMDGYTTPLNTRHAITRFHRSISLVTSNVYGLGQYTKTGSKIDRLSSGLITNQKDTSYNVNLTMTWLRNQSDYSNRCTIYINRHFAYNPRNMIYQQISDYFWDEYSKEYGSWRDQLLWCYVMDKYKVKPVNLYKSVAPMKDLFVENRHNWGFNGHKHAIVQGEGEQLQQE